MPSARTLLLLYAADLAFRLRWQIRPALAEGRTVVAAPYVDTAMAFGRAAGLQAGWLTNLFSFAPRAAERHFVHVHPREAHATGAKGGFVGFACDRASGGADGRTGRRMLEETAARLRRADKGTPRAVRAHRPGVQLRPTRSRSLNQRGRPRRASSAGNRESARKAIEDRVRLQHRQLPGAQLECLLEPFERTVADPPGRRRRPPSGTAAALPAPQAAGDRRESSAPRSLRPARAKV